MEVSPESAKDKEVTSSGFEKSSGLMVAKTETGTWRNLASGESAGIVQG